MNDELNAWGRGVGRELGRVRTVLVAENDKRMRLLSDLQALVDESQSNQGHDNEGLISFGSAALLARYDHLVRNQLTPEHFDASRSLGEIHASLGKADAGGSGPVEASKLQADISAAVAEIDRLRELHPSVGQANPGDSSAHQLLDRVQSGSTPRPKASFLYIPADKRGARMKTAAWTLGLLFLLALMVRFGWFVFLPMLAYFVASFLLSNMADQDDDQAAAKLKGEVRTLHEHASQLVAEAIRHVEDARDQLAETIRDIGRGLADFAAKYPGEGPSNGDLVFGAAVYTPFASPNWKGVRFSDFSPSVHARLLEQDWTKIEDLAVRLKLGDCDSIEVQLGKGAPTAAIGRYVASQAIAASDPGRARFMFVEPGRLCESYRVFGALNESDSTRLGDRLFVNHVSEMGSAVDALRTFVGRTKEAMTRQGDEKRRITAYLGEGEQRLFLQRAVVVLDSTGFEHWPEKDRRRLQEYFSEFADLARVGATEGSVLLITLTGETAPLITGRGAVRCGALSQGWIFKGGSRALHPPPQANAEIAGACDAWVKAAKGADSSLRQSAASPDWSDAEASDSRCGLEIEVGRHGADRPARLVLGREGGHHAICIGRTGSGKTNLFHVIIGNLVRKYSPDELELYLLDFKEGVEFAAYADVALPHCRAVAIDADRGFGMSVLAHLRRELNRRANVFKAAGVGITNLEKYEVVTGQNMPRIVLLIDEFQVLLQGDKTLGAATGAAAAALEDLVRRGRSFGLHVILGSQTLAGRELTSAALGQFAVRIVLPSSPADASMLLGEQPVSGQLRSPGDAIIWNAGQGEVSDFHLAKIFAAELDDLPDLADKSRQHSASEGRSALTPYVFRGSGPNELSEMLPHLERMQSERKGPDAALFAIGASTIFGETPAAILGRSRARNALFVHRNEEMRQFFTYSAAESFLRLNRTGRLILCDLDEAHDFDGRPLSERLATQFPTRISVQTLEEVAANFAALDMSDEASTTELYIVAGAHLANLAKEPGFARLLKHGPEQGRHLLTTCDTVKNLERVVERTQISEFGIRALGPASASDSQRLLEVNDAESLTLDHQYVVLDDTAKTRLSRLQVLVPECLRVEHGERAEELADV